MRIISGFLKGRKINFLKNSITRPLKDSVKENIFNLLKHSNLIDIDIKNADVLDLYSGVGSFGLECISRGANKVTFIEKNYDALKVLQKNILGLPKKNKLQIINGEIKNEIKNNLLGKYDIIFLDPPFASSDYMKNLEILKEKRFFKNNHIIIIHRERESDDELNNLIKIIFKKEYGRSKIIFGSFA